MLRLVKPEMPGLAATVRQRRRAAPMHFRFEINFIVDRITGRRPVVRILEIAWLDKREHISRFLLDYHARYHRLPADRQDLGSTSAFGLGIGTIDFGEVRRGIRDDLENRPPGWPRRLLSIFLR